MIESLGMIAPGKSLREGLDRILQANMGALIVVGDGPEVLSICSGGFLLDSEFSPQRLSELAKMDGAIILAADAGRIARANVHLVPSPTVATTETGTRHRTAERVARSLDVPVITVSEDRSVITVYRGEQQRPLVPVERLLARANQALETLEGYRDRLDVVTNALSALEVEDMVTVRDVVTVLQRAEMVRRIAEEVDGYSVELGTDGRLVRLQLVEMLAGVEDERRQILRDYLTPDPAWQVDDALAVLSQLSTERLLDLGKVANVVRIGPAGPDLEAPLRPYGYRLLSKIPRLPDQVVQNIVRRYGGLQQVLRASIEDLDTVEGIEIAGAHFVKEGLARLAETSVLDRLG
jgi:diadenylate cyclase